MFKIKIFVCLSVLCVTVFAAGTVRAALECTPCVINRVSITGDGAEANNQSHHRIYPPSISADGRHVAFHSDADNLVASDTNGLRDIFVHDRVTGHTERVSVRSDGTEGNGLSNSPHLSAGGRYVAFMSEADNLVPNDNNQEADIFIRDRVANVIRRISIASNGTEANGTSVHPRMSADGRFVTFVSDADSLDTTDTNGESDVFLHDRDLDADGVYDEPGAIATTRLSVAHFAPDSNGGSYGPDISEDGRYVAFSSAADNLVPGDSNNRWDIFVYERLSGNMVRITIGDVGISRPSLNANGRYVAFMSAEDELVFGPGFVPSNVFVHDRDTDEDGVYDEPGAVVTKQISIAADGSDTDNNSAFPSISADGWYVAYSSAATNIVSGDGNNEMDIFVHDRQTGETRRVSLAGDCSEYDSAQTPPWPHPPVINATGRYVAFTFRTPMLVPFDTNGVDDVFVADLSRDFDEDGIVDADDNYPRISNPGQADTNGDSIGDACAVIGLLDLGTLGGATGAASAINEFGQVVGWSETSTGQTHAFQWSSHHGMQDLGTLGGANSWAYDINDHGQIVGHSEVASGQNRAVLWKAGQMSDLGTLGGGFGYAGGINNLGYIVGASETFAGHNRAFLYSAADGLQELGTFPGGTYSGAKDINVFNQVVGDSEATGAGYSLTQGFIWDAGGAMQAFLQGPPTNYANAINSCGQIVGASVADGDHEAFLITPEDSNSDGRLDTWFRDDNGDGGNDLGQNFGALLESEIAYGINDRGEIVGRARPEEGPGRIYAFLRTRAGIQLDLGTLGGTSSQAYDINKWREAVGDSTTATGAQHAVLFSVGPPLPTPVGSSILMWFRPLGTGGPEVPVSVVFDQITEAGTTRYSASGSGPVPPGGFILGDLPVYFDVTSTTIYTGTVTVCANYSGANFTDEGTLALFHYEDTDNDGAADTWVDRTVSHDPANDIICAGTSTLSSFAIFEAQPSGPWCPFQTAANGTAMEKNLRYLRAFRDRYMAASSFGRSLVKLYYQHGTAFSGILNRNESLRTIVRWAMVPIIVGARWLLEDEDDSGIIVSQQGMLPIDMW